MSFPVWRGEEETMQFFKAPHLSTATPFAALLLPWQGNRVLLAKIKNRGWCIPSGRIEPGESSADCAVRECHEESGASVDQLTFLGSYKITKPGSEKWADVYNARVIEIGPLPSNSEASEIGLYTLRDLPTLYYMWNPLTEAVFNHAYKQSKVRP